MPEVQGHPSVGDTRARTTEVDLPTIPDDLVAMLDLLCQTIVTALGFGVAVVNIVRPDGSLLVVSVAGDDQARERHYWARRRVPTCGTGCSPPVSTGVA